MEDANDLIYRYESQLKELTQLRSEIESDLLKQIDNLIHELKKIGLHYRLVEEGQIKEPLSKTANSPSARFEGSSFCKVCSITGHDGRLHRGKKPKFSREDLIRYQVLPPSE